MPIYGNRHGLHAFQFPAYGNRYRCRIPVTNVYPEVQSVRVHGSQSDHLLPEYIQTLIIVFVRGNFDLYKRNGMALDTHHEGSKYK